MNALVIGCGRVGSSIALQLVDEGWDVTAVDEKEEAFGRLGDHWNGRFVLGHGMDIEVLREAGIEEADAVVVATDGDNTNIVIGQVAQHRFDNQCVVVRVLDPARADFYPSSSARWPSIASTTSAWSCGCSTRRAPTSTAAAGCARSARPRSRSTF